MADRAPHVCDSLNPIIQPQFNQEETPADAPFVEHRRIGSTAARVPAPGAGGPSATKRVCVLEMVWTSRSVEVLVIDQDTQRVPPTMIWKGEQASCRPFLVRGGTVMTA